MTTASLPVCHAPSASMYLDVNGRVTVCAANQTVLLGRVGDAPLLDLWRGEAASGLRAALARGDLSHGCQRCAVEIERGNRAESLAAGFDRFAGTGRGDWPRRLEMALSTACNLQCVMCSGEYSSSIRAFRERLPPLPPRYGPAFFEELRPFLRHLDQARFLGGEPFLAEENFTVWEMMIAEGLEVECNVTTNGTRFTPRVERVLQHLPFSIGVSVDGFRPETVERIRVGASYEAVTANIARFHDYATRRGTSLSLTYCLMVDNWRELGDFLLWAEDLGCHVYVNPVVQPPRHSLYRLPVDELTGVVDALEREGEHLVVRLHENRGVWEAQLDRLRHHLDGMLSVPADPDADSWADLLDAAVGEGPDPVAVRAVLDAHPRWGRSGLLRTDAADRIVAVDVYAGLVRTDLLGRPSSAVRDLLFDRLGPRVEVLGERQRAGLTARLLRYDRPGTSTLVVTVVFADGSGGTCRVAALSESVAAVEVGSRA